MGRCCVTRVVFVFSGLMAWLNRLVWLLGGHQINANIVVVGLPGCGKSTIMHQLKPRDVRMLTLTPNLPICCPAEKFTSKSLTFIAFDLDDLEGFGSPWDDYYRDCHGIIFVLDSSDRYNLPLARTQVQKMLANPHVKDKDVPVVFLANKMDQTSAMSGLQLTDTLGLRREVGKRPWSMHATSAITGEGFNEAFDWLAHKLRTVRRFSV